MTALATFDKHKVVYRPHEDIEIAFGKNRAGNDHIIDHYKEKIEGVSYWLHLCNESSAHAIIWFKRSINLQKQQKINAFKFVKSMLTEKKDDDVIFCLLSDVEKTTKVGEVKTKNEKNMSDSSWSDSL